MDDGLAGLVSVICSSGLTWGDWSVINQLEQVLSITSDDCKLLAVLTESIELVGVCSLELFTGDVGKLSFGDEGFGFGSDELLLEDDDLWRVWLLVLELGDLVGDLLLAWSYVREGVQIDIVAEETHDLCLAGLKPQCCGYS